MARLIGKFIIGSIGNVTYKKRRKQQILSAKAVTVKQTKATKSAAGIFGKASSLSYRFRSRIDYIQHSHHDGGMVNRLTKTNSLILRQCFDPKTKLFQFKRDSFDLLKGFDFNTDSPFRKYWWTVPEVHLKNQQLSIRIPEFSVVEALKFPEDATSCTITFVINLYSLDKSLKHIYLKKLALETLTINADQTSFTGQEWLFDIPEGCIILCAAGIRYYKQRQDTQFLLNHKTLNPTCLLNILVNEGTFTSKQTPPWYNVSA